MMVAAMPPNMASNNNGNIPRIVVPYAMEMCIRDRAHSLYVFILSFHWHKLINDVILQRITYNNYLVEIGRYRWLHYQGFALSLIHI